MNSTSKNKCDLSHTVPKNLGLVLTKTIATVSLEENIQSFAEEILPRFWLFTCSHVECHIYDISPPNLVGGHKHPFHGGDESLSSTSPLCMLGDVRASVSFGHNEGLLG